MSCPELADLEQYVCREMNEASRVPIEQHVASCPACRDRINEITENLRLVEPLKGSVRQDAEMTQAAPSVPDWIGPYRVLRRIGRGGMGVVYEAEQQNPRRTVALKVLHSTTHLDDHYERLFRREVQVLARLKHPSIAAIHEAGRAPDGRSYFAMELVQGVSLLQHAGQANLSHEARLRLFKDVCDAIAYAHQRGIIHRDIKPSNILVDAAGRPKVLDFGLAKVLEVDPLAPAVTAVTEVGRIQGTLPYMSPEQVRGEPLGIDIRSDVYSLGVVLYELVVGRLPYVIDSNNLLAAAKAIIEQQPVAPSSIDRTLRGDLETILKKALEKDKERRYQSAAEFAEDIRRYLHDETVIARPPSRSYQLRKFAKRNRPVVAAAAAVFLVLVAGIVGVTVALQRARSERDRAIRAEALSAERLRESEAVTKFMTDIIASAKPAESRGREVTVLEAVEQAASKVDSAFPNQPELEAHVRLALAVTYRSLGKDSVAETHIRTALKLRPFKPGDERWQADCQTGLAQVLRRTGALTEAETYARKAVEYAAAILAPEDDFLLATQNNLAIILEKQGRLGEAEVLHRQILAVRRRVLGGQDPAVIRTMNNLAVTLNASGKLDEAEQLLGEVVALRRVSPGTVHPSTAMAINNLAAVLLRRKALAEAEPLFREAVEIWRTLRVEDSPDLADAVGNLGTTLCDMDRASEGLEFTRQSLEIQRRLRGDEHWTTGNARGLLGGCLRKLGELASAEQELREAHRLLAAGVGPRDSRTQAAAKTLIEFLESTGETAKAKDFRDALTNMEAPPKP